MGSNNGGETEPLEARGRPIRIQPPVTTVLAEKMDTIECISNNKSKMEKEGVDGCSGVSPWSVRRLVKKDSGGMHN